MSTKEVIELALGALLVFALSGMMIAGIVALYLDVIRPRLVELREEQREQAKEKITGIHFGVEIERSASLKEEPEMVSRHRAS